MGLFGLFKAKPKAKEMTIDDVNPFDLRSLIAYYKSKNPNATDAELLEVIRKLTCDDDLEHLTPEGDLPWGWFNANKGFTEPIDKEYRRLSEAYYSARHEGAQKQYATLKPLLAYMKDIKKLCIDKGECFEEWSKTLVANAEIMEHHEKELQYLEENMAALIQREKALTTLKEELKQIIAAEPGVIQSTLYKRFDPILKTDISNEIYQMEVHNVIVREKSGRSYKLFMK